LATLTVQDPDERILTRIDKYSKMGHYRELAPSTLATGK
jgi:hypothetical protein